MTAYYNEFNKEKAAWLRELIKLGVIAPGEVDDRDFRDITAQDLKGFTQHHFFAGIGVWSYVLRNAGWQDDRPVVSVSLPCQSFSVAGKQKGKNDERHLLPNFINLVRECEFDTIFGEQVEAAIRHGWLDDLQADMEAENYAIGHCVLGAHSINAAHQRQRLFWVALAVNTRSQRWVSGWENSQREDINGHTGRDGTASWMGNTNRNRGGRNTGKIYGEKAISSIGELADSAESASDSHDIEWLYCRDGKYRPIKSGITPLVNGFARGVVYSGGEIDANSTGLARRLRLIGYGDAINADVTELFIRTCMETISLVQINE